MGISESSGGAAAAASAATGGRGQRPPWRTPLWLAGIVLLTVAVRIPTFRLPLDQDGSVYSYIAARWSEGELPYRDVWDHKPPFIYVIYRTLFAIAPPPSVAVNTTLRVASAACDAATALLLFLLGRRLFGRGVGLAAGLVYGLFSGATVLQVEALQPERVTALLTTAALLAAAGYADSRRLALAGLSGLLFGVALVTKQIAAPIGLAAWAWVTWDAFRTGGRAAWPRVVAHSALLAAGALLPWALCAAYFASHGAFGDFWECTVRYNAIYASEQRKGALVAAVGEMAKRVHDHGFLWLAGAAGAVAALARRPERRAGVLVALWAVAALVALVLPGQFAFYYFLPTVAPLALAAALALAGLWRLAWRPGADSFRLLVVIPSVLVLAGLGGLAAKRSVGYLGHLSKAELTDRMVARVARYIAARTEPDERIYMRGGRPQVYILSGRRNVCPYLYDFHYNLPPEKAYLYSPDKLQAILAALERDKPPYIVVTKGREDGGRLLTKGSFDELDERFPAFKQYLAAHYEPDPERPEWQAAPYSLLLFRRRAE